jgi:hypothetical protein
MRAAALPSLPVPASRRTRDAWLFIACLLGAGVASILARQDANWDLANYHLYNPWAWLTGRYGHDLAPAQLQTYHNPLLDVPFYAMVAADWPPRAIAFAMGLPAGIAAFFVLKLSLLLFANVAPPLAGIAIAAAAAIGLTGANGRAMLGSTMNEWHIAAFVMAALWLIVADRAHGRERLPILALAGLLVGLASGLKLTAATYAVGIAVALFARRDLVAAVRDNLAFGVPVLAGLALTLGPWMAWLHADTGNPLFPYFNDVFRSPLIPPEPILASSFGPKTLSQWLSFPFVLGNPPQSYVSEVRHRDLRLPALAALALLALLAAAGARPRRRATTTVAGAPSAAAWRFLAVFFVASFLVWARLHSIYRYLLAAELVTGILIVGLALRLTPPRARSAALVGLAVLIVATTRTQGWGRTDYGQQFLEVAPPPIAPGALVVLTGDAPLAHVLLRFPADARHVGLENNLIRANAETDIRARAAVIVAAHPGPIYQLAPRDRPHAEALAAYGLVRVEGTCAEVRSNIGQTPTLLCGVERVARQAR